MKQLFSILLICFSFSLLMAQQKNVSVTPELEKRFLSDSINIVIGVPSAYCVKYCSLILTNPIGGVFRTNYNTNSNATKMLRQFIALHEKGSKIIFADIEVLKGGRKLKLAEQHYIYR